MSGIHLVFSGYTVELTLFNGDGVPRVDASYEIEQTANGTPLRFGTAFLPKSIWSITAIVTEATMDSARRLYAVYRANPGAVRVHDYTWPYVEPTPRTRALATGATANDDGTTVSYFAQWNAEITDFEITKVGRLWELNISLTETTTVAA